MADLELVIAAGIPERVKDPSAAVTVAKEVASRATLMPARGALVTKSKTTPATSPLTSGVSLATRF
jgi:hypothetical protein